jgi:trigger factor
MMQIEKEITKEKNARINIQVTVDRESVDEAREEIIRNFEREAKISGFRKGKIPRNVIVSRFGQDIQKETVQTILTQSLTQILRESEYRPITDPWITEIGELNDKESFSFKAACDLMPEVKLGQYEGVSVAKTVYDVKKDSVQAEIENLRERFATLVSIDEKAKEKDYLVIDYEELSSDGKGGEKKENQTIFLDDAGDPFAKQLIGLKKDDEKEVTLERERETEDEEKDTVTLRVVVQDVKKRELPALDDDFAKDISDAETMDELRQKIHEDLEERALRMSEEKTKEDIMEQIVGKAEFDIPESMIAQEIDRMLSEIVQAYRIDVNTLREDEQKLAEYRNNLRPRALSTLRYELVLAEIVKQAKIEVEDEQVDAEIKKYAEREKRGFEETKGGLEEKNLIDNLRYRMKIARALDLVYEKAKLDKEKHVKYGAEEDKS